MASPFSDSVNAATGRIQEIIDTAERVSGEIQADARAEAKRYADQKREEADHQVEEQVNRLSELADNLTARVAQVNKAADELAAELRDVVTTTKESRQAFPAPSEGAAAADADEQLQGQGRPEAASGKEPEAASGKEAASVPEEALLRATQLAVSGSSRAEIEDALRSEFGLSDPTAVTDEILG